MKQHELYMQRCFELAQKGRGYVSPNPLVGSVIVKEGKIISEGFHKACGLAHAEKMARDNCTQDMQGAILYCNLEPCCHTNKKTPPCAQRIIAEGIKKVVIANLDPNPLVAGKGVELLRASGIEVITGIMENVGAELNEIFFHHIIHKTPFIHLKWAQTQDGFMARSDGSSKWISCEEARSHVHNERWNYDAICVGANTLRMDNPHLTARVGPHTKALKRIILTESGKLPMDSHVFTDEYQHNTIIAHPEHTKVSWKHSIAFSSLKDLMEKLYAQGICSLYVEGGAKIHQVFLQENIWNKCSVYVGNQNFGTGVPAPDLTQIPFATKKELLKFKDDKTLLQSGYNKKTM